MSNEVIYPDTLIRVNETINPANGSSIGNGSVSVVTTDNQCVMTPTDLTLTDTSLALDNTATLTPYTLTMSDPNNDSTTIVNPLQIVITDGVSGIVNSMTNVNSSILSGNGFKEVATTPENIILSDTEVTLTKNTITKDDMTFALGLDDRATYGRTGITLSNGVLPNTLQISQDSILLSKVGKSIEITQEDIIVDTLAGTSNQVLKKNYVTNVLEWGNTPFVPTATEDLDMDTYGIINVGNIDAESGVAVNMNGQFVFDTPPHVPDPVLGFDAASKGYVDTLIGNYSGNGLTLYFNYNTTQTDPIIAPSVGDLQQTLVAVIPPTTGNYYTMRSVAAGVDTLISTFTTDVGFPNTLTIPTGLWSMLIWGYTTTQTGQLYYHFHLNEVTSAGVFVAQIGTSGFSSDVNAVNSADPDAYHCSLALVAPYTMASLTNRLQIQIYSTGTGAVPLYLFTLFGGDYYSNVTTTLSGSTSLLTENNTWTGVNTFTAGFNTTAVDSATTLSLGTGTATTTTLGRSGGTTNINGGATTLTSTTLNLTAPNITITGAVGGASSFQSSQVNTGSITTNTFTSNTASAGTVNAWIGNTTGIINIATSASRSVATNIQNQSTIANTINIGSAFTTTTLGGVIKGITTLGISTPIVPTGITYNAGSGTGAISTSAIGAIINVTGPALVPSPTGFISSTFVNIVELAIPIVGVYQLNIVMKLRNDGVVAKADRLNVNLGYGASGGTGSGITTYLFGRVPFGSIPANGDATQICFSRTISVSSLGAPDNFVTLALQNNGTEFPELVSVGSTIQAVRIA